MLNCLYNYLPQRVYKMNKEYTAKDRGQNRRGY